VGGIHGEARTSIAAPPEACLAELLRFEAYPEWYPFVDEIAVLERDERAHTFTVRAATRLPIKTFTYRLRYIVEGSGALRADYLGGDLKSLTLRWELDPGPENSTEATLALDGEVGWALDRLLAPVRDAARRELIDDAVAALGRRVEALDSA